MSGLERQDLQPRIGSHYQGASNYQTREYSRDDRLS
ncbi:hypothetical protein ACVMB1_002830 [Bradyrhizobium sp. USDA 4504]